LGISILSSSQISLFYNKHKDQLSKKKGVIYEKESMWVVHKFGLFFNGILYDKTLMR